MFKSKFLQECEKRGFIYQCTNIEELDKQLCSEKPVVAYWGTDPTGASLHVGHLFSLMMIRLFQKCGNKPIIVIGGATAMIGDPSGKDKSRPMITRDTLEQNKIGIKKSLEKFIKFGDGKTDAILVDNYDWWKDKNYIEKKYKALLFEKKNYIFKNYKHSNTKSILFPGCNFSSFYPNAVKKIADIFRKEYNIGIAFDCCGKPIAELEIKDYEENIIKEIE